MSADEVRLQRFRFTLLLLGIGLAFWWPISHWFYSDWYHRLLGFEPGSYPDGMVKVIGTCGIYPVLLLFVAAKDPARNRWALRLGGMGFLAMSATFLLLVVQGTFPTAEVANVAASLVMGAYLMRRPGPRSRSAFIKLQAPRMKAGMLSPEPASPGKSNGNRPLVAGATFFSGFDQS